MGRKAVENAAGWTAMTDNADPAPGQRVRIRVRVTRWDRIRRLLPLSIYGAVVLGLILSLAWVVHLGIDAQHQLTQVRRYVTTLRSDVTAHNVAAAELDEQELAAHAHDARRDTDDPFWRFYSRVPGLGNDLAVAGGLARVADNLANQVLPPLATATLNLQPDNIRSPDGSIDVAKLSSAHVAVNNALPALADAQRTLAGLRQRVSLAQVGTARTQLASQLGDVQASLTAASQALDVLPPMLGATGPRRYLLVFQNLAEARGTGGLVGAYGVLDADHGSLTLATTGTDSDLEDSPSLKRAAVDLGAEFDQRWEQQDPYANWFSANDSPDWPSSATLLAAHYDQQFSGSIDGVIAIDPVTLSYLLGPDSVHLSNGANVAGPDIPTYTEQTLYNQYGETSPVRKQILIELAKASFSQLKTAPGSRLLAALERSAGEGHLQVWSSHNDEEKTLSATPIGSQLPGGPGSFAYVSVQNEGPKTDFWLDRSLTYIADACPASPTSDSVRDTTIEVKLTDRVPPGQNAVVGQDMMDPSAPYGRGHSQISIYAAVGAQLVEASLNGQPVDLEIATERGHTVFVLDDLFTPVGQTQDIQIHLEEPVSTSSYSWRPQPLARPQVTSDTVVPCAQ